MSKSIIETENETLSIRVNRKTGSNVPVADALDAYLARTGRNSDERGARSEGLVQLALDGANSAELVDEAGHVLTRLRQEAEQRLTDRRLAREALDVIIGALRRGEPQAALEAAHLARWGYFKE